MVHAHKAGYKLFLQNITATLFALFKNRVKSVANDPGQFSILKKCYVIDKILGVLCFFRTSTPIGNIKEYSFEVRNSYLGRKFWIDIVIVIFN